jgi:adenylate cyclase class IV
MTKYEVEWKVELSEEQAAAYRSTLKSAGFIFDRTTPQNDFYIEAKESPYGGFDLKRYRQEDGEFIYTEKVWEMSGDTKARKEIERNVTEDEFRMETAKYPHAIKVIKDREWFTGRYEGKEMSVTIDSAKFDHSQKMRYFTEAEICVESKEDVAEAKRSIKRFLMDMLKMPQGIPEAPGMFMMAFKKL